MDSKSPIQAYPLAWPAGWPRSKNHKAADFGRTSREGQWPRKRRLEIADGVNRVLLELGRLHVARDDVVISTNVRTRLDGLPRSGEAEPKDSGAAVYWVKRGGKWSPDGNRFIKTEQTQVMAVDRYNRVADNLAAIAATLDAMRAIERHGGAQILERAFTGFQALPAPAAGTASWRIVLGIEQPANKAELDAAYRRARSDAHPDRGGTSESFDVVEKAYLQACLELGYA